MTALIGKDNKTLEIGRSYAYSPHGWVAMCDRSEWGMVNLVFLERTPIDEKNNQLSIEGKIHRVSVEIPRCYTGYLVSESAVFGVKSQRWYWFVEDGRITNDGDRLTKVEPI
jgi:hypothetical protein